MTTPYLAPSRAESGAVSLQTALGRTPSGLVDHPTLFGGFVARPDVMAAALLAVADIAATQYADFGLAKRLANLDPVVTASGDRLRFESFSACNGVQARFDLLPDGIESGTVGFGTTNVDVNAPLRRALAAVDRAELLHLDVGPDELRVSTPTYSLGEPRVVLPERWVRGFAETPLLSRALVPMAELTGPAVSRFVTSLPRSAPPGPDLDLLPVRDGLRPVLATRPGTVHLAGACRVRGVARIMPFASRLRVYGGGVGASAWVFDVPGGRFTLLLSPGGYRGFSGEGSLLTYLTEPVTSGIRADLAAELAWQPEVDVVALAARVGADSTVVERAMAWLSASGAVGFDVAAQRWFHRDLPVADVDAVLRRQPRLAAAHKLVANDSVRTVPAGWQVVGSHGVRHQVARVESRLECSCTWEREHHGTRGPCKHVLAALLSG